MKSSSPSSHGLSEGKEYPLKFGTNFERGSRAQESYHVLRCKYIVPHSVTIYLLLNSYIGQIMFTASLRFVEY